MAQRLLVHARLCRQMAGASLDEAVGEQFRNLADECTREAEAMLAADGRAEQRGNIVGAPTTLGQVIDFTN